MTKSADLDSSGEEIKPKKPRKPRMPSPTEILAQTFVRDYLHQTWDYRTGRRWLKEAAEWVNPLEEKKARAYPLDIALGCLSALKMGLFDFKGEIKTLRVLGWGTPPYIEQYERYVNNPPPHWNKYAVKQWETLTGLTAYVAIAEAEECAILDRTMPPKLNETQKQYF